MKHMCHEAGGPTKTLALHCDSVASRGMAQRLGAGKCRHIEVRWLWLQQAMNEKKQNEEVDERQDMETDEPDGNEFGCCGGVSCAAANGDKTRRRRILTVKCAHPRGDENLGVRWFTS